MMRGSIVLLALVFGVALGIVGSRHFSAGLIPTTADSASRQAPPPKLGQEDAGRVEAIGYVEPISEIRQLTFKTGGIIDHCRVKLGDRVGKGDLLMSVVSSREAVALEVAKQELQVARADEARILRGVSGHEIDVAKFKADAIRKRMAFLQQEYERIRRLEGSKTATLSELQRIEADLNSAKSELAAAEAEVAHLADYVLPEEKQLAAARVQLADAKVRQQEEELRNTQLFAPLDGTVLEILKREGESVSPFLREPVLLFADLSTYRVRAEVDERYVHRVKIGQEATVYGRNLGDRTYRGKVALVKKLMGSKTVFARSATERKDLEAVQVLIDMEPTFSAPSGLRADVRIEASAPKTEDNGGTNP